MHSKTTGTFLARLREKFFKWRLNREIFNRISPHLRGEENKGYLFQNRVEMQKLTANLDVQSAFEDLETQIQRMPAGYGASFRHIMHRDLSERLRLYADEAQRRVQPEWCDPRFVATRA